LAAILLGGLQALAMNLPLNWGAAAALLQGLSLCGLVVLLNAVDQPLRPGRRGFFLGWAFATAWLSGSFWWLFISMNRFGGLAAPLAALAVLALAAALSIYSALAAAFYTHWRAASAHHSAGSAGSAHLPLAASTAIFAFTFSQTRRARHAQGPRHPLWAALVFASAWTLAELARGTWFTGFPWGAGGYAQVDGLAPLLAPWVGVYGVGAVVAFWAAGMAFALANGFTSQKGGWGWGWGWVGLFLVFLGWVVMARMDVAFAHPSTPEKPSAQEKPSAHLALTLLQGDIPQDEKFEGHSGVPRALAWYRDQIQAAVTSAAALGKPSLVITPETAVPLLPQDLPAGYWEGLTTLPPNQALLLGLPLGDWQRGYSNSVLGFQGGAIYRYDKHHLVPFGEFIPIGFRWFTDLLHIPMGDFKRGALSQPPFDWQGQRLAPLICYEDLFGEELGPLFESAAPESGDKAPTILVSMSNLAWFGDSTAVTQHLQISRMRAMEFARPVVRATNTGATAVIDAQGQVTDLLPPLTRGLLKTEVTGGNGLTPYAWWVSRWGLLPLAGLALLICGVAFGTQRGLKSQIRPI
jgi:apolipoprotein N-acyltransferase